MRSCTCWGRGVGNLAKLAVAMRHLERAERGKSPYGDKRSAVGKVRWHKPGIPIIILWQKHGTPRIRACRNLVLKIEKRTPMKKFYLLDHSLIDVGGHHYEYAMQILQAAEAAGYAVVLGCHKNFTDRQSLPKSWNVACLFRHSTYNRHARHLDRQTGQAGNSERGRGLTLPAIFQRTIVQPLANLGYRRGYARISAWYQRCCQQLFTRYPLAEGDVVFLPTMSGFDLHCLAEYLQSNPATQLVDWHLQFHFNFLEGRDPDYSRQEPRRAHMAQVFSQALQKITSHRLHFYSTTQPMTAQFQRMGVADFQWLPYPTNEAFRTETAVSSRPRETTLRLVCPGHVRQEKGRQQLADFFADSYEKYFQNGRMQLQLQLDLRRFLQCLPNRIVRQIRADRQRSPDKGPVVPVQHPLDKDQYVQLIRDTNIGLLLYDSKTYYARCSGILVEMLTAGVPVIVPAGCWLSEQIAEVNYQHLDRCRDDLQPLAGVLSGGKTGPREAPEEKQKNALSIPARGQSVAQTISLPRPAQSLLLSFGWQQPALTGTYVRFEVEQFDAQKNRLDRFSHIEGQRAGSRPVRTRISLRPRTTTLKVTWSNAYHTGPIALVNLEYSVPRKAGSSIPSGAVGLTLADRSQIQPALEEMLEHYEHYRRGAREYSRQWSQRHAPQRTLEILEQQAAQVSNRTGSTREQAA